MIEIGTLVTDTDSEDDFGLVVGYWEDKADGTIYNKVKWLNGRFVGHTDYLEKECLEAL